MAQIKTFEAACKKLSLDPVTVLPDVSPLPAQHGKALLASAKLFIIVQAVNAGWIPDWQDSNQNKYYPWFDMEKDENNPSGFRLYYVYDNYAISTVGSRLCYKSRALAEQTVNQFIDLYRDLIVL